MVDGLIFSTEFRFFFHRGLSCSFVNGVCFRFKRVFFSRVRFYLISNVFVFFQRVFFSPKRLFFFSKGLMFFFPQWGCFFSIVFFFSKFFNQRRFFFKSVVG